MALLALLRTLRNLNPFRRPELRRRNVACLAANITRTSEHLRQQLVQMQDEETISVGRLENLYFTVDKQDRRIAQLMEYTGVTK